MSHQDLRKGIVINFIAKYSNTFVQLIITSILARILLPNEFGVVAVVTVFITFFYLLGDMGIGPAIIQNKDLKERDIINIFNFTLVSGFFLAVIFALCGGIVAKVFNDSVYVNVCRLLSFGVFFSIATIVPQSLLYKYKKFKTLGIITVSVNIVTGIIAILLAKVGFSYYALIFQSILSGFLKLIFIKRSVGLKFKIQWGMDSVKVIRSYSAYQFAFNFVNYFSRNFDNLLIGKVMGPTSLGYYDKAYKLMLYPLQSITFVITPVLHPVLSEYQKDMGYIFKTYKKLISILSLIGGFFAVYCFFAAQSIILILFGENWVESVPTFQILALSLIFQMVSSSSGAIFQATNNVKYLFVSGIISAVVNVVAMLIGSTFGKIEYVGIGIVVAFAVNFFQVCYILSRYIFKKSIFSLLVEMKYTIVVCSIMTIALSVIKIEWNSEILNAAFKLVIAIVSFIIGLLITKQFKLFKSLFIK